MPLVHFFQGIVQKALQKTGLMAVFSGQRPFKVPLFLWFVGGALLLGLVGLVGYIGFASQARPKAGGEEAPPTLAVTRGDVSQTVSAPGQLLSTRRESLRMGIEGTLAEVKVKPGDTVKKGDLLASMADHQKFESSAAEARLKVGQARKEMEDLLASAPKSTADARMAMLKAEQKLSEAKNKNEALKYPRATQSRIDAAWVEYQQALNAVALAQEAYDGVAWMEAGDPARNSALKALTSAQNLRDSCLANFNWYSGKPSQDEINQTRANLEQAQAELEKAQRTWDRVKDGVDPIELELVQAKLAELEAESSQAQAALEKIELRAPFAGVVLEVKVSAGDPVLDSTVVVVLADPGALEALVTVVEEDFRLVQPGQQADLFLDAQPEAELTGRVTRVVPARASGDRPLYPVYISVEKTPEGLAEGMTVDSSIRIATRTGVLTLPKALVRTRGDGTANVEVWQNGERQKRTIQIGLIGDQSVEVLDGLQEGELVVSK